MKQRLAEAFPLVLATLLPIAGLLLAVARFSQDERTEAYRLLAATALGLCLYALVLTA